jgi:drug/metabolite transporter (DMT)-like permease
MALLLIGTGGLAGGFGIRPESGFAWGVGLAIVGSVSWGCYSVDVKGILDRCDPLSAFGVISLYTLAFVAIPAFAVGHPGRIFSAGWGPFWMAALSGAACIGAGHVTYLAAISILGATRAIWVTSMAPAVTAVLSAGVFGEAFPPLKAAAAALTVLGAAVIAMPRFLPARTPPDEAGG